MGASWFERLLGNPAVLPLRHLTLNLVLVLACLAHLFFFFVDMAVLFTWARFVFDLAMLGCFIGIAVTIRVRGLYRGGSIVASLAGLVYLGTNFFGNGGSDGSGWMVTLVVLLVLAILHEPRAALWWASAALAVLAGCLVAEAIHPEWILAYRTPSDRFFDLTFTFVFCTSMLFPLVLLVMRFYEESNERTRLALASSAQTEKLAALGETMASLNHEISNPLGIMDLALTTAQTWWTRDFPGVMSLLQRLPAGQGAAFWDFLRAGSAEMPTTDRRARAEKTRQFRDRLAQLGWRDVEHLAEQMADYCAGPWNPAWEGWLRDEAGPALLEGALRFLDMAHSYRTASTAHDRLMSLVSSLSQYSHAGERSGKPTAIRLADSLDLVLSLFVGHRNKTVDVVRRYEEVPPVLGHNDELLQVWTNLVKNALSAMHDQGTLTLSLIRDGESVVVLVDDTGPGVPPELRAQVFEPFFTTKGQGKGTGLGLPIVRRIVAEHGGSVTLTNNSAGGARFEVRLPVPAG